MNISFLGLISIFLLIKKTSSYFVTVDAHDEECFYETASKGTTLGITFEVAEGGFLDVDIEVRLDKKIYHHNYIVGHFDKWHCLQFSYVSGHLQKELNGHFISCAGISIYSL